MRNLTASLALLTLAACGGAPSGPVDVAKLPPMGGQEMALLAAAEAAAQQGQFAQAEKNYLDAVSRSEGHVEAHLATADFYVRSNQPVKAREVLQRAAQFQPGHVAVNYQLGKLYLQAGNATDALTVFERGLATQPTSLDLLSGAGIACDILRKHEQAQRYYQLAMAQNSSADLTLVRTNLAMSYLLSNKPDKVIDLLKTDAAKPDASPVTRHNLALAYGMLGRHAEAKKILGNDLSEDERQASLRKLRESIAAGDKTPAPAHIQTK